MSSQSTHLWSITVEILENITRRLYGGSILRLWCSGEPNLRLKLSKGGVCAFAISDDAPYTTSRYPKALRHFQHLRDLKIIRNSNRLGDAEEIRRELQLLPPTIESLHLLFPECCEILCRGHEDMVPYMFESLEKNPDTALPVTFGAKPITWDLKSHFPRLRSLKFGGVRHGPCSDVYDELPDTLTRLTFPSWIEQLPQTLEKLPRTLLDLGSSRSLIQKSNVQHLPPNLTRLVLPYAENFSWIVPFLPKNLLDFQIKWDTLDLTNALLLPPLLTKLSISGNTLLDKANWIQVLARLTSLQELHLGREIEPTMDSESIRFLPRSLTCFTGWASCDFSTIQPRDWPPNLHTLVNHNYKTCNTVSVGIVSSLPRSLTSLGFNGPKGDGPLRVPSPRPVQWPLELATMSSHLGNLTSLSLSNVSGELHENSLKGLPPRLTKLDLAGLFQVSSDWWAHLPRSISDLSIKNRGLIWKEEDLLLAPSLNQLKLESAGFRSRVLGFLPRHLESLTISISDSFTQEDVKKMPRALKNFVVNAPDGDQTPIHQDALQFLPESLTTLKISPSVYNWSGEAVGCLPRKLKQLHLGRFPGLKNQHVHLLPPELTDAAMKCEVTIDFELHKPSTLRFDCIRDVSTILRFSSSYTPQNNRSRNLPIQSPDPRVMARFKNQ